MKITTRLLTSMEPTVPAVNHVSYSAPAPSVIEITFTRGLFGGELAYVEMSPDEAEVLAKELIIRSYRARNNK